MLCFHWRFRVFSCKRNLLFLYSRFWIFSYKRCVYYKVKITYNSFYLLKKKRMPCCHLFLFFNAFYFMSFFLRSCYGVSWPPDVPILSYCCLPSNNYEVFLVFYLLLFFPQLKILALEFGEMSSMSNVM